MPSPATTAFSRQRSVLAACCLLATLPGFAVAAPAGGRPGARPRKVGPASTQLDLTLPADSAELLRALSASLNRVYDQYLAFKSRVQTAANIQYSVQVTTFGQFGTPHGGTDAGLIYSPVATWQPFANTEAGAGIVTFGFTGDQFWTHQNAVAVQQSAGLLTPPNGWGANGYQYTQITYTQTLRGNQLAASAGQYSIGQFDGNLYAGSVQTNFFNYALAQNASQTYANAGTGAYLQAWPIPALEFDAGLQGATDILGHSLTIDGFGQGKVAEFAALRWAPASMDGGAYQVLYYNQPGVPLQPGASQGLSFSAAQNFGPRYGVFLRVNNASGKAIPIETSVAFGGVVNNPFGHNRLDQAGLGLAWNQTNRAYIGAVAARSEWVVDGYYNFTVFKAMQIGPDVQFYPRPALAEGAAAVISLRTTLTF